MTGEAFRDISGVSRETLERLQAYIDVLFAWNARINLVGRQTLNDPWRRHILDSSQLKALIPASARTLVDLGSGAGLPGLILAIVGVPDVHLIEADQRKCAFLREAARITGTPVTIHPGRIEHVAGFGADVITSRALASLPDLLDYAVSFLRTHSILLFLKGRLVEDEVAEARKLWMMRMVLHRSLSDPSGTVLQLEEVTRARQLGSA